MANSSNRRETKVPRFNKVEHRLLHAPEYLALSTNARVLMQYMQAVWTPYKATVGFGVADACLSINCSKPTALRAFKELEQAQFIHLDKSHQWWGNKSDKNKVREWILTWMPNLQKPPTNDWKNNGQKGKDFLPSNA